MVPVTRDVTSNKLNVMVSKVLEELALSFGNLTNDEDRGRMNEK